MFVTRRSLLALCVWIAMPATAFAADEVYTADGAALGGTDVVAYFTQMAPVPGDPDITHDWMGVTWRFASTTHRDQFAADPTAYAPQYGGYCAYAVSEGYTAPTDPEAWSMVEAKLYLNYSPEVQALWGEDIPGRISAANANWPDVLE